MEITPFIEQSSGIHGFRLTPGSLDEAPQGSLSPFITNWLDQNKAHVKSLTTQSPAVLFRGFPISDTPSLEQFVRELGFTPYGEYGDLPKEKESDQVYKSTPFPANKSILFHNESSHLGQWPHYQFFNCRIPAKSGGATPLIDCRKLLECLPDELIAKFESKKLMYVRTFKEYLDTPWQDFFKTQDRATVEQKCQTMGYEYEWFGDELQIRNKAHGVLTHPTTEERSFFNQVQLHHGFCFPPKTRASLIDMYGEDRMPRNVLYGDGSPISDDEMTTMLEATQKLAVRFEWEQNDLIMLDNLLTAHARDPFDGERKIAVAMAEMVSL